MLSRFPYVRAPRVRRTLVLVTACVLLPLTGFSYAPSTGGRDGVPPQQLVIGTERLASGLGVVTGIATPDDGSDRMLVAEKRGTVRSYRIGKGLQPGFYLDMRGLVDTSGYERGLVGIATSPDFKRTHTLFVAYTAEPGADVTLGRIKLDSAAQARVSPDDLEVVLTQEHSQYPNHNGGQLVFGPDGYLYWGIGDGGGHGAPLRASQDLSNLLGKISRIDVMHECGDKLYCVPEDNPFVEREGARPEIWAYGMRNPWRFSFDPADGSLWIADVGEARYEEIDRLFPEEAGANLGWSCYEGPAVYNEDACRPDARYEDPIFSYSHEGGDCSVTGGFVYRGERYDIAEGTYVLADWCTGNAWGVQATGRHSYRAARIGAVPVYVNTFAVDSQGELYLATGDVFEGDGALYRVTFDRK